MFACLKLLVRPIVDFTRVSRLELDQNTEWRLISKCEISDLPGFGIFGDMQ